MLFWKQPWLSGKTLDFTQRSWVRIPRRPYELIVTASVKALGENCTHQKKNPLRTRNVRAFVMTTDSMMSGGIVRSLKMQKSKSDFSATAGEGPLQLPAARPASEQQKAIADDVSLFQTVVGASRFAQRENESLS